MLKINHVSFRLFLFLQLSAEQSFEDFFVWLLAVVWWWWGVSGGETRLLNWPGRGRGNTFIVALLQQTASSCPTPFRMETGRSTGHVSFISPGTSSDFCSFLWKSVPKTLQRVNRVVSLYQEMECIRANETVPWASWGREPTVLSKEATILSPRKSFHTPLSWS